MLPRFLDIYFVLGIFFSCVHAVCGYFTIYHYFQFEYVEYAFVV
jgi:hypothetical protein